jgi:nucleotide-binding universal stress UspA family protein
VAERSESAVQGSLSAPQVIVCGTNATTASDIACEGAALLARHFGARLLLVSVVERREHAAAAGEVLARHARERLGDLGVSTQVLIGDPAHALAQLARRERPDLVVIGVHQGSEPLVPLGIEAAIAAESRCPVLILAAVEQAKALIARFEAARGRELRCTVCGRNRGVLTCSSCGARIAWESMEHKWHEELHEDRGLMGLGGARAFGPVVGPRRRD